MSRTTRTAVYSLPTALIAWIEKRAAKDGNGSKSAYVASILRKEMEREKKNRIPSKEPETSEG